jgi:hypothetical protein
MVARVFKFLLQDLEGHFYYDQNYFLRSERSWLDEESFSIFCKEWEGYIVVSCDFFNVILLLIR